MARASSRGAWKREQPGSNGDTGATWVLFLHGNASTVASRMNVKHYTRLHELGLNVLAPDTEVTTASRACRRRLASRQTRERRTTICGTA